jgi:pentatricopeptide repeat protein
VIDEMPKKDAVSWKLGTPLWTGTPRPGRRRTFLFFELFQCMPERNVVSWSMVVSAYCKKGDMEMVQVMFDKMPTKNLVTWTIMVSACAQKGPVEEVGCLFTRMKEATVELDVESGSLALGNYRHVRQRNRGEINPCMKCPNGHVLQVWMC